MPITKLTGDQHGTAALMTTGEIVHAGKTGVYTKDGLGPNKEAPFVVICENCRHILYERVNDVWRRVWQMDICDINKWRATHSEKEVADVLGAQANEKFPDKSSFFSFEGV